MLVFDLYIPLKISYFDAVVEHTRQKTTDLHMNIHFVKGFE